MNVMNNKASTADHQRTVHSIFEARAEACPNAPAVYSASGECWSYSRLNSYANRIAHGLLQRGIKPEQPIGVCMQRSPQTVGVLLGILKSRAAYVALDLSLPIERLRYIVQDARLTDVLVDEPGSAHLKRAALDCVDLLSSCPTEDMPDFSPRLPGSQNDLLTLLYTSGSTGKPKGAILEHASALRLVVDTTWLNFSTADVFLQISALSFDISSFELWGPLLNGGSVVTAPPSPSIVDIEQLINTFAITTLWMTSGLFNVVMEERPAAVRNLKYLLTGGDVVSPRHARIALQHMAGGELLNCYGPTENATFSSCHRVKRSDTEQRSLPIGLPVNDSPVYILDDSLKPVRDSETGEIFVGGVGLSRGYWERPELNAQKFVLVEVEPNINIRLYRTGDLGRYNRSGLIEFLGRNDFQVKIRGFRVEPEEIELALCAMPSLRGAAVIARGVDAESKILCCAYVSDSSGVTVDGIKTYLKQSLPDYMIPTLFREVSSLPRNANDKVDRRALDALFVDHAISTDSRSIGNPLQRPSRTEREKSAKTPNRLVVRMRNLMTALRPFVGTGGR